VGLGGAGSVTDAEVVEAEVLLLVAADEHAGSVGCC